jgi:pimeloyl-ACP methyl ester carboxylesterase
MSAAGVEERLRPRPSRHKPNLTPRRALPGSWEELLHETGAAAALIAAAERRSRVGAVVSCGGRPDLAADALPHVTAPALLIVGGSDTVVIELNRRAQALLGGESRLEIVPGAGHRFEEPRALKRVASLTRAWFVRHLHASAR